MSFAELLRVAERGSASRAPLPSGMNPDLPFREPAQIEVPAPAPEKAARTPKQEKAPSPRKRGPQCNSASRRAQAYCQEPRAVKQILASVPGIGRTGIANLVGRGLLVNLRGPRKTAVYVATERAEQYREAYADAPVPPRRTPRRQVRETLVWHRQDVAGPELPKTGKDVLIRIVNPGGDPVWPGYHNGERWCFADGSPIGRTVLAWCDMPMGRGLL